MEAFLLGLIAGTPGPFRPAVALVVGGILRVFQWTDSLLKRVHYQWNPIADAQRWANDRLRFLRDELYNTLKHTILIRIPQWANNALNYAVRWASDRLTALGSWARGALADLTRWATARLGELRSFATAVRDWAAGLLSGLLADARALKDRVFGLLGTPARMAEWLAAAMWSALWRYGYSQADRIGRALWSARRTIALRVVVEVERLIGRIIG